MDNDEGGDNTSPIARIKRRTKSKHHPDNNKNYFDPDLNDKNNNKENFDQLNRQNTPTANEGIGGRDVIYSKDDNMVGVMSMSMSKTDRERERNLILNPLENQPLKDQIKQESELANMNMEKAKYYINEERRRRGDPSNFNANGNDNANDNDKTIGTHTNLTREQMIQAAEESAFSAKFRGNQPFLSPTAASSYINNNYNRGNNNSNNNLIYNKHEANDNVGTGSLMTQVNSNINSTLEKFMNKTNSEFVQETYQEPSLRPGNVQLGLPRVYIPEKYADFLLNDENGANRGKVKKEKKLPLYMKVMAEAERQAQVEERNRNEMIIKVKREKQQLGKIDIKTHMVNHDKLMKQKYGDRRQLPDVSAGRSDNNSRKMDRLDSLPLIKNQNERGIDRESSFVIKKNSKMNKLQRGIDDESINMSYIGNNRNSNNNDQYNANNVRLPSIIFDEGGPAKGVKKSSAYLRIQRENKNKKDKKELDEEERREKLRRMREFGKNLRVLASQKEAELLDAKKRLDDPYESPKKGTQMVSPRIKHVSELANKINSFSNYSSPNKTTKSKMSSSRSSGNGNISQEDTVNIQLIDPKSGKIRTKYDYMDESHEASDGEMHGFSLLSSDRTPFKSPKKVRFNNVDEDLDGFSQVFKISDQMKSPMKGEIEGSSDFLYSPSLKSKGNKKFNNSNDDSNSNSNSTDDDPVVMLSKVAGGPLSYHPDWVNQLLTDDPDEEKYAEIYEQGYSIMMLEYGILSEL